MRNIQHKLIAIMEVLVAKNALLQSICDEYMTYFLRLKPILEKTYTSEIVQLQEKFDEFEKLKKVKLGEKFQFSLPKLKKNESKTKSKDQVKIKQTSQNNASNIDLDRIFHDVHLVFNKDVILAEIYQILAHFNLQNVEYSTTMSLTYISETQIILHDLQKKYDAFKKANEKQSIQVIITLSNIIENSIALPDDLHEIHSLFKKYPKSIHLYAYIMQKYIDTEHTHVVVNLVNDAKNTVLNSIPCEFLHSNNYDNPSISTFGLFPVCNGQPLQIVVEISTKTTHMSNASQPKNMTESDLQTISQKMDIIFIVLHRKVKNPLEFKIWQLFDSNQIPSSENGVNSDILARFSTITRPTLHKSQDPKITAVWDFSIHKYGDKSSNYVIFDTIDLENYRILMPYHTPGMENSHAKYILQAYHITPLLQYIENPESLTSTNNYHKIMIQKAQKTMFLDSVIDVEKIEKISQIHESKYLKNMLFHEILETYSDLLKTSQINSLVKFSNSIHTDIIYQTFESLILKHFGEFIENNRSEIDDAGIPQSEILATFLSYLKNLSIEFRKEMHAQYLKTSIDVQIFEKDETIINHSLNKDFQSILLNTLQTIITDETNIYQTSLKKLLIGRGQNV